MTFANGVITDYAIDERNRLTGIVTSGLMNVGLQYDPASNAKIPGTITCRPARAEHLDMTASTA